MLRPDPDFAAPWPAGESWKRTPRHHKRRTRICAIDAAAGSAWHARSTDRPFVRAQFKRQRDRCIRADRRLGAPMSEHVP
jgi:hypothetical protein